MNSELDFDFLREHVANGIVREQKHPTLPLAIYNYSRACQYDKLWDDVTLQCRGLVLCGDYVVARPFRKFFNDTEHQPDEIPWHRPCEVTEKLDGSLLIVFHFDGKWHAATRGSFTSEQSQRGLDILRRNYGLDSLSKNVTYLFEVIYPENRIVLNYGDREDVILLGMIETYSGVEFSLDFAPEHFTVVRRLPPTADARELRSLITDDQEGYVVRFDNGFRVKVKGARYLQLHRLLSGVSSRSIWETLAQGRSFAELLELIPDEYGEWVREEKERLLAQFDELNRRVEQAYLAVKGLPDRKAQALCITANYRDVASAVFATLDRKPIDQILWKQLYPEHRLPSWAMRLEA